MSSIEKVFSIQRSPTEKGAIAEEVERITGEERASIIKNLTDSVARKIEETDPKLSPQEKAVKCAEILSYSHYYVIGEARKKADEKIRGQVDEMTGLYKQSMVETSYARNIGRIAPGKSMALIAFDIDYFKTINDSEGGHPAGDKFLKEVGQVVREHIRNFDIGCRKSGDEFTILLSDVTPDEIRDVMARIAGYIGSIEVAKDVTSPTISAGCVVMRPGSTLSFQDAFKSADQALYVSKKQRAQFTMIEGSKFAKYNLMFMKEEDNKAFHYDPDSDGDIADLPKEAQNGRR